MNISFDQLRKELKKNLLRLSFTESKADLCAGIFAANSRDGVYSHGLNRFPVFVKHVEKGLIDPQAEPSLIEANAATEIWDGHLAPGMYTASICMDRAIALARQHGISCVTVRNTNHWMRGGTYGWQAADAGCVGICFTNAIAGMPAWGGQQPVLGNNPLVIAVPRREGHVVLDMAMSQYSYGKLQEYELRHEQLPIAGGYDEQGKLTTNPSVIRKTKRALPAGYWKGSGLAMLLDILLVALSGGRSTAAITASGDEYAVTQCFICLSRPDLHEPLINEIIAYVKSSTPADAQTPVTYPGERTLRTREKNERDGIPVDEGIWKHVLAL
ncbi:MAG: 3-dehydro-L-gulonate 2-dehydrogenase [Chitinophagaceae bacterium]